MTAPVGSSTTPVTDEGAACPRAESAASRRQAATARPRILEYKLGTRSKQRVTAGEIGVIGVGRSRASALNFEDTKQSPAMVVTEVTAAERVFPARTAASRSAIGCPAERATSSLRVERRRTPGAP